MLSDLIHRCQPGQIQVVISSNPLALIPTVQQSLLEGTVGRLTLHSWQELPPHEQLLDDVLHQMATLALAVWPAWYSSQLTRDTSEARSIDQILALDQTINSLQNSLPLLSLAWLKLANARTAKRSLPLIHSFSRTVQCEQLALALDLSEGIALMALTNPFQDDDRLRSLARVCGWLAPTANARVFVVIPPELASSSALDSITYQAEDLTVLEAPVTANGGDDEETYKLWPVHGQPHPCSPGEQLLAARLAADGELAGLFRFNQLVRTALGTSHLVDLLWADGRLIVEVDGYRYHGNPQAFCQDRQRDYELLISGYLVLRLPHSEVIAGIETAMDKIRRTVRFRRRQPAAATSAMP